MITFFCLIVYGAWPHQAGIPLWAVMLSIGFDLLLMAWSKRK